MLTEKILMKKNTASIVKPPEIKHLNCRRAVFIPADTPSRIIKTHLEKNALKKQKFLFSNLYRFKDKAVLLGGVGAPASVLVLEPLICSGATEILLLGFCGGLTKDTNLFDPFIVRKALSEEGTSSHYIPFKNEFFASEVLSEEIREKLKSNKSFLKTASIVSTDAPYRETKEWLTDKQIKNIELVDMETSSVFALAEYYQIKAAAVMVTSDIIKPSFHKIGFTKTKFAERIKEIFFPFLSRRE